MQSWRNFKSRKTDLTSLIRDRLVERMQTRQISLLVNCTVGLQPEGRKFRRRCKTATVF